MQAIDPDIVEALYGTTHSFAKWQPVLDRLHPLVGANSAGLIVVEKNTEGSLQHQFGVTSTSLPVETVLTYNRKYAHYEAEQLKLSAASRPGTCLIDPAFNDAEKISRRPDVAFAIQHLGIRDRFGVRLNEDAAWHDVIAFQYSVDRGNVTPGEFARLQPYLPHLAQSIVLGRIYEQIRNKYNAVLAVLDRVAVGVVLLQADSTVIHCNQFARQIIDQSAVLSLSVRGQLNVVGRQSHSVAQAIFQVATNRERSDSLDRHLLGIDDGDRDERLLLELSPLNDSDAEFERGLQCVIGILIDPGAKAAFDTGALGVLYSLTPSETHVAELIGQGYSQPEIAETRNTSTETIKKQSAALFRKMNTNSRAGVIRRLMSIRLPFLE